MTWNRPIAYGVLLAGALAVVLAHWPGSMNIDTLATIAFVRTGFISDQLSPVLTWVWRQGYRVAGVGPGVVLALQTVVLTAGLYLILRAVFGRIAASVLTVVVLLAPPTFGLVGLVGRDAWFVACCMLATGLGVGATRWSGRAIAIALAGAVFAAAVAIAARQNGFTAVAPILVGLAVPAVAVTSRPGSVLRRHRRLSAAVLGIGATLAIVTATTFVGNVVRDRSWHPEVYTYLYDLGHLTIERNQRFIPALPPDVQPVQTVEEVKERWAPHTGLAIRFDRTRRLDDRRWLEDPRQTHVYTHSLDPARASEPGLPMPLYYDDGQADRLSEAWRSALLDHPFIYLSGRVALWKRLIGVGQPPVYASVQEAPPNPFGYAAPSFPLLSDWATVWRAVWAGPDTWTGSAVHRVWPYLLLCLMGLALLLPRFSKSLRMVGALMAAVVGLQVGLFFLSPSVELRFQLLTLYAGMIVLAVGVRLAYARTVGNTLTASDGTPRTLDTTR